MHSELKTTMSRQGSFQDYGVQGVQYENESGEKGWHITAWHENDFNPHDYWVSSGQFYSLKLHLWPDLRDEKIITRLGVVEPNSAEKEAVLAAMAKWEASVI